jgi:O-antigen/teichoic acid export membrane protein
LGLALLTVLNALTYVLVGADRPIAAMAISGVGVVVTGAVCLLLVPSLGLLGAAWGTTAGAAVTVGLAFVILSRHFPNLIPWGNIMRVTVASLAMYFAHLWIGQYFVSAYTLPILYIILTSIYVIILTLTRELTKHDFAAIKALIPHKS